MKERDGFREERFDDAKLMADVLFGAADDIVYFSDDFLQERDGALLFGHDALPVPLIDVQRMRVIQRLVRADGVHIGVYPLALRDGKLRQRHAFPFGQGLDDLGAGGVHLADGERDRLLGAVQIVVDAGACQHEERGGHPHQVKLESQIGLKILLDQVDGLLGLAHIKRAAVVLGDEKTVDHGVDLLSKIVDRCPQF